MLTYLVKFDTETRLMELISETDVVGTAADNNTACIRFDIHDKDGKVKGMGGRCEFDLYLYDSVAHEEFKPIVVLDSNNQALITNDILAGAVAKKLPFQLVFQKGNDEGETFSSLNILTLHINRAISPVCPKSVKKKDASTAFEKVQITPGEYGTLEFTAINGSKTVVRVPSGAGEVYLNDELTSLNPDIWMYAPVGSNQVMEAGMYVGCDGSRAPKFMLPAEEIGEGGKFPISADAGVKEFDKVAYISNAYSAIEPIPYVLDWVQKLTHGQEIAEFTLNGKVIPIYAPKGEEGKDAEWGNIHGNIELQEDLASILRNKVNVITGKGLSANDFTDAFKTKLDSVEEGATKTTIDAHITYDSKNPVRGQAIYEALEKKNDKLVSGVTIKTINGSEILGSGDLIVGSSVKWGDVRGDIEMQYDLMERLNHKQEVGDYATRTELATKQDRLIDGHTIRTINGTSLLGAGDIKVVKDISKQTPEQVGDIGYVGESEAAARADHVHKKPERVNAANMADKLTTPRNIQLVGAVAGKSQFDGGADVQILTEVADIPAEKVTQDPNHRFMSDASINEMKKSINAVATGLSNKVDKQWGTEYVGQLLCIGDDGRVNNTNPRNLPGLMKSKYAKDIPYINKDYDLTDIMDYEEFAAAVKTGVNLVVATFADEDGVREQADIVTWHMFDKKYLFMFSDTYSWDSNEAPTEYMAQFDFSNKKCMYRVKKVKNGVWTPGADGDKMFLARVEVIGTKG